MADPSDAGAGSPADTEGATDPNLTVEPGRTQFEEAAPSELKRGSGKFGGFDTVEELARYSEQLEKQHAASSREGKKIPDLQKQLESLTAEREELTAQLEAAGFGRETEPGDEYPSERSTPAAARPETEAHPWDQGPEDGEFPSWNDHVRWLKAGARAEAKALVEDAMGAFRDEIDPFLDHIAARDQRDQVNEAKGACEDIFGEGSWSKWLTKAREYKNEVPGVTMAEAFHQVSREAQIAQAVENAKKPAKKRAAARAGQTAGEPAEILPDEEVGSSTADQLRAAKRAHGMA